MLALPSGWRAPGLIDLRSAGSWPQRLCRSRFRGTAHLEHGAALLLEGEAGHDLGLPNHAPLRSVRPNGDCGCLSPGVRADVQSALPAVPGVCSAAQVGVPWLRTAPEQPHDRGRGRPCDWQHRRPLHQLWRGRLGLTQWPASAGGAAVSRTSCIPCLRTCRPERTAGFSFAPTATGPCSSGSHQRTPQCAPGRKRDGGARHTARATALVRSLVNAPG
jgi:hypothetical protein